MGNEIASYCTLHDGQGSVQIIRPHLANINRDHAKVNSNLIKLVELA